MASILDDDQIMLLGDLPDRVQVRGMARIVNGKNYSRPGGDAFLNLPGIKIESTFADIGKQGHCTLIEDAVGSSRKCHRAGNGFVPLLQSRCKSSRMQCCGPRTKADGVCRTDPSREGLLKFVNLWSGSEPV